LGEGLSEPSPDSTSRSITVALGALGDLCTFTPPAGSPGAGVVQTGIVIGLTQTGTKNKCAYNFGCHTGDDVRWAHECEVSSVSVLTNQTKHNG